MPIYKYNGGMGNNKGENMNTTLNVNCMHCDTREKIQVNYADFHAWKNGTLIQDALPYLDADQRELLISKTCGPCFDKMFGEDWDDVEIDIDD